MKRVFSHVIKIALVLAMIICWVLSIGYTNRLASVKNTFNIYFDEEEYLPADIYKMQKEEKDKGWEKEKIRDKIYSIFYSLEIKSEGTRNA